MESQFVQLSEVWTSLESPNRLFSWVSESEAHGPCNLILAGTGGGDDATLQ